MASLKPLRAAVVGAGPASLYAAEELATQKGLEVQVDVLERLPVPTGLVRSGVAPDHQPTKAVSEGFAKTLRRPNVRILLDVEVGRNVSYDDLIVRYHAVIYAVGADAGRTLGINGEELRGSLTALDLVHWYNGHPSAEVVDIDLGVTRAVVVGNGNVALDVARVLLADPGELARTDISDRALECLRTSALEEVVILGRHGIDAAAFSASESLGLRQALTGLELVVEGDRPIGEGRSPLSLSKRAAIEADGSGPGGGHRLVLRFFTAPVTIVGEGSVTAIKVQNTKLVATPDGPRVIGTGDEEVLDCGLVVHAVGFSSAATEGVPFDVDSGTRPNIRGRVSDGARAVPGVYVAGWAKRGPSGGIGTNRHCAIETVAHLLEDLEAGVLQDPVEPGDLLQLVPDALDHESWLAIDAHERAAGRPAKRPRRKLDTWHDLRATATSRV